MKEYFSSKSTVENFKKLNYNLQMKIDLII